MTLYITDYILKDFCCFLEQETLSSLLSTGWYRFKRDLTIKLNREPYGRLI